MRPRAITLKTLAPTAEGAKDVLSYKALLMSQIGDAGTQGLTINQIRERMNLLESLKVLNDGDVWVVSHDSHKRICDELKAQRWRTVSPNIVQFFDDINDAPEFIANKPVCVVDNTIEEVQPQPVEVSDLV